MRNFVGKVGKSFAVIGAAAATATVAITKMATSAYADYEITYFPDIPVNYDDNLEIIPDENGKFVIENEATHYFFINEDHVYDVWFYNNRLSMDMQIELLQSVNIQLANSTEISGNCARSFSARGAIAGFSV